MMSKKVFEDEFMNAQSDVIALALELLEISEKDADKIFIYIFQNDIQIFFNTFFSKDGKIVFINDWFSDEQIYEYFDCGIEDTIHITDICKEYNRTCPNEFRLVYNVKTKAFDCNYNYDDIVTDGDKDLVGVYNEWIKECETKLNSDF